MATATATGTRLDLYRQIAHTHVDGITKCARRNESVQIQCLQACPGTAFWFSLASNQLSDDHDCPVID